MKKQWLRRRVVAIASRRRAGGDETFGSDHAVMQFSDACDRSVHLISDMQRPDARRRPGVNQVARLERIEFAEFDENLGQRPDEFGQIGLLPDLAVDRERDGAGRRMRLTSCPGPDG